MGAGTVIVGTGQAGFQTAASLRSEGYQEPITLIGEETQIPYQRPPLSKGFPLGQQDFESIQLRPERFYQDHRIDLLAGKKVTAIERDKKQIRLESGAGIPYQKLVLAVGARNRMLGVEGARLDGVLYLRSLEEAIALKERLQSSREIVVIGGGFIGLEIAAVARTMGKSVTVFEGLARLMWRVVAPVISEFFQELHASRGVKIVCDAQVLEISGENGRAQNVK